MKRNLKNRQSMILGIAVASLMISVGFFTGCISNNTNNNQSTYVVLSTTQHEILDSVNSEYAMLLTNRCAEDARAELVNQLNSNYEEVANAELGEDNYTIFIDFSNGRCVAFDTFDSTGYNDSNISGQGSSQYSNYAVFLNGETHDNSVQNHDATEFSSISPSLRFEPEETLDKMTCGSKKVLMLAPSGYEDVTAHNQCEAYFKNNGWKDEDITIKANMENYSMDMRPEDFFHLDEYGIILIFAHGSINRSTDEKQMWLESCTLDNETIRENELYQRWFDQKILITRKGFRPLSKNETDTVNTTNVHWYYSIMIRLDILRQNIGSLPDSFVHIATCNGIYFKDAFMTNGAKIVLSWKRSVYKSVADTNQVHIVKCMLEKNYNVYSSYQDNTVIRSYTDYWTAKHLLIEFLIYPPPNKSSIAESFYFPAWFDKINIIGIPNDADSVKVTLISGTGNSLKSKSYRASSSTLIIEDLDDVLFPATGKPKIEVKAFDGSGKVLASGMSTIMVSAGANSVDMSLSGRWYEIGGNDTAFISYSEGFSLDVYLNGALLKKVPGERLINPFCDSDDCVIFKAEPGDTIRLVGHCDWNMFSGNYSISVGELWLSLVNTDFKMQLFQAQWLGWSKDSIPNVECPFDKTFTIPDFE